MNRREMLNSGFLQLVQALPRLVRKSSLSSLLTRAAAVPPPEALSFPLTPQEAALPYPKPLKKED